MRTKARLAEIELNEDDSVKHFRMQDGSTIEADLYVSAMPGAAPVLSPGEYNPVDAVEISSRFSV